MSSSSIIVTASSISHQVTIYLGIPIFILGIIGGCLNFIVFLSLKTFRESSCAFYLTVMSIVDVGYLITGLLTFIMMNGFGINWTEQSRFYCIFREGFVHICILISFTCLCLATIGQYLATCPSLGRQQLCSIKLARCVCMVSVFVWCLHGITFFTSYDLLVIPSTGARDCIVINDLFHKYFQTFHVLILLGVLPVCITVIFGCLAYRNIKQFSYLTIPLGRREFDKQLTMMVLTQVVFNFFAILPYIIIHSILLSSHIMKDPIGNAIMNCMEIISIILHYSCFANPFYIYLCASERFRHQLIYVLCKVYFQRRRRPRSII